MSKILAIDYGEKHLGLSISDEEKLWAFPYGKIEKETWEQVFEEIKKICQKENIERIVIGLPLSLDSRQPSPWVEKIQKLKIKLEKLTNIAIDYEDERLTTRLAEVLLKAAGRKGLKKIVDKTAATLILQSYLERVRKK